MQVWFTADLHLGHANIIKFCQRPFMTSEEAQATRLDSRGKHKLSKETVKRHDEALVDAINTRVSKNDMLWILGDFCKGTLTQAQYYRGQINCQNVYLVWGNHDHRDIQSVFTSCREQGSIEVEGQNIWLSHYPMRSWLGSFHGSWHLYGHVHGNLVAEDDLKPWMLVKDVGVDACNYAPISFTELYDYMTPRIEKFKQRKEDFVKGDLSVQIN